MKKFILCCFALSLTFFTLVAIDGNLGVMNWIATGVGLLGVIGIYLDEWLERRGKAKKIIVLAYKK